MPTTKRMSGKRWGLVAVALALVAYLALVDRLRWAGHPRRAPAGAAGGGVRAVPRAGVPGLAGRPRRWRLLPRWPHAGQPRGSRPALRADGRALRVRRPGLRGDHRRGG